MGIKLFIKKCIFRNKVDSDTYIRHLKSIGMSIGDRVNIYEPRSVCIDETRPFMIKIGDDVKITRGVTILTHGYDWSVLARQHDIVLGSAGRVNIGDNVFIGMNATILKGVTIGSNVVIGANSLVNKNIPDNCVAAGNPCKIIMSIDEYYEKRKNAQISEALEVYDSYIQTYGCEPPQEIFDEFFWLFHKREEPIPQVFKRQMMWNDRYDKTLYHLTNTEPVFDGYDSFLDYARQRKKNK